MTIPIDLGTKVAIKLAIQCYLELTDQTDKKDLSLTISYIIDSKKLQRIWIQKKFPSAKYESIILKRKRCVML